MRQFWIWIALAACSKSSDQPPPAPKPPVQQGSGSAEGAALGTIAFAVSDGSPEARAHFTRGLAALHSFWYDEAKREFQAAIDADPAMNMAYWGAALSRCKLYWREDDLQGARALLQRMPAPARLSERERAWVDAATQLVAEGNADASRKRFAAAMEQVHAKFPDDESAAFLALALLSATPPGDPNDLAVRKRAGELALGVYRRNPNHPGAAHYLIHAYDTPELAAEALPFARTYAKIAPAAFHAQHMPAHIFARLGMWKEAIASCRAAWDASVAAAEREKLSADHYDLHSLNWVIEMSFELGRRKDADTAFALYANTVRMGLPSQQRGQFAIQVGSYLKRTGEWQRVDELLAPLDTPATDAARPPATPGQAEPAPSHCAPAPATSPTGLLEQLSAIEARANAAAARHDVAATKKLVGELDAVIAKLRPFFEATQSKPGLARIDQIDDRRRRTLLARAGGNDGALLAVLRESAAAVDKEPATGEANPTGSLVHEEIGDALMRVGKPKDAAAEFDAVLVKHPNRARALLGAARALAKAGDAAGARARYEKLVAQWDTADPDFPGLAEAKAAVAK
jgi:tetratricopeptide (TPR) repeat protein